MIPELIKAIQSPCDYKAWWNWLEEKGQQLYGSKFRLYEEDAEVILKLMVWCLKDAEMADKVAISLRKGILLAGSVGCGKTSLMGLVRLMIHPDIRYRIKPCRDIAFDFAERGYDALQLYMKLSFVSQTNRPIAVCFDDLGLETNMQHFGNGCNTMGEILLSRYDYFIHHGMITHLTTNLNSQDIEDRYGRRVRSRCRELFNFVAFGNDAADKRK